MEYGILVAESEDGQYQVIGAVDSIDEARELAEKYLVRAVDSGSIAPDRFVIHRRGEWGWYTVREPLELDPDDKTAQEIAERLLGIKTLETRNSDSLDFHSVSVWKLKAALKAAWKAGKESQ
jgi:hypothetical protein